MLIGSRQTARLNRVTITSKIMMRGFAREEVSLLLTVLALAAVGVRTQGEDGEAPAGRSLFIILRAFSMVSSGITRALHNSAV